MAALRRRRRRPGVVRGDRRGGCGDVVFASSALEDGEPVDVLVGGRNTRRRRFFFLRVPPPSSIIGSRIILDGTTRRVRAHEQVVAEDVAQSRRRERSLDAEGALEAGLEGRDDIGVAALVDEHNERRRRRRDGAERGEQGLDEVRVVDAVGREHHVEALLSEPPRHRVGPVVRDDRPRVLMTIHGRRGVAEIARDVVLEVRRERRQIGEHDAR
eukprot:CAMPEP_0185711002 /NCGR_PEP_ID=MMETSP1164-20130828/31977_1 /TAXON_ID=1104430 /ORGANISM="Chrysoreinhardia sp, Strain CCMP2950" /LENGTH=213 /DNA_ID=CAMNT_0028378535 /DNA_START=80 /DNA_END=717 /DNA_ORIENTATION=+